MSKIKIALNIIRTMKNWPVSVAEYFGFYGLLGKNRIIYILRNGIKYEIRTKTSDRAIFHEIWIRKYYTPAGFTIKEDDVVVEIGAHIGIFSIFAAQLARNGKVYSFEPMPANYEMLQRNIILNKANNIIPVNKAVSDKKGKKEFHLSSSEIYTGEHSFFLRGDKLMKTIEVETLSLENIVKDHNISEIDFLKMDCEGAEYEILFNVPDDILRRIKQISMECHDIDNTRNKFSLREFLKGKTFLDISTMDVKGDASMLYAKNRLFLKS